MSDIITMVTYRYTHLSSVSAILSHHASRIVCQLRRCVQSASCCAKKGKADRDDSEMAHQIGHLLYLFLSKPQAYPRSMRHGTSRRAYSMIIQCGLDPAMLGTIVRRVGYAAKRKTDLQYAQVHRWLVPLMGCHHRG